MELAETIAAFKHHFFELKRRGLLKREGYSAPMATILRDWSYRYQ
jgi:hypothetical protein